MKAKGFPKEGSDRVVSFLNDTEENAVKDDVVAMLEAEAEIMS